MKTIAKVMAVVLVIAMLAALAACGSSGPEGKYVVKSINGQELNEALDAAAKEANMSADEYLKQLGVDKAEEMVTIELKSEGKAVMEAKMFGFSEEGTWKQDGDQITITLDGDSADFTLKGNELSNNSGEPKYVLVKK